MYCPKCGTQNLDDASFCSKCGTKIDNIIQERDSLKNQERLVKVAYISNKQCSNCKEKVTNEAFCPKCKSPLEFPLKKKNNLTAFILSLIIPGLGNLYVGYWALGISFFLIGILIGLYDVTQGTNMWSIIIRLISAITAWGGAERINMPEKHIKIGFDDDKPVIK